MVLLGSTLLNFVAVFYLPLTITSALMFSAPLWICLLSIPLLGEEVGWRRWVAMMVGFGGILIVARPWTGELHWAVFLSLGAALCGCALCDPDAGGSRGWTAPTPSSSMPG